MQQNDKTLLAIGGLIVFVLTSIAFFKDFNAEWKEYQDEFIEIATAKLGEEKAESLQVGIQQIWNEELGVTDRCTTCHMGIMIPGFENQPNPYKTHPDLDFWNKSHNFKDYGCTTCHGGQGFAVKTADAHGEMKHWLEPMYTNAMAQKYGFKGAKDLMQINCNTCHRNDPPATEHMEYANLGKKLMQEKACIACHVLDGKNGGSIGPDLTYEGSKHGEHFDMTGVKGEHSVFNWHMEHFQNPPQVSPGSIMPPVALTEEEARALAIVVMSWQKKTFPVVFTPSQSREEMQATEE